MNKKKTHSWSSRTLTGAALMAHRLFCDRKYTWSASSSIDGVLDIWDIAKQVDLSFLFQIAVDLYDGKQMICDL